MHPVYMALPMLYVPLRLYGTPVPYVPLRVTRGALVANRFTHAPPGCRTSHDHRTFIPLLVSLWNDPDGLVFDGARLAPS